VAKSKSTLQTPQPNCVSITVRDHGLGIPEEARPHVFEQFFRAHEPEHRSGMGIGLYISHEIVELHGGRITLECPPDGGTRFRDGVARPVVPPLGQLLMPQDLSLSIVSFVPDLQNKSCSAR